MPSKYIDGNAGGTWYKLTACNAFYKSRLVEADIAIATDINLDWVAPSDHTISADNAWSIAVHEFGHALGLGHGKQFSAMWAGNGPFFAAHGGDPLKGITGPHYDDASGVRRLYYSGNAPTNIYASSQGVRSEMLQNNNESKLGLGIRNVCPGEPVTLHITVGNNGSRDVHADEVIFLQRDSHLPSIPVKALRGRQFDRGQTYSSTPLSFKVPAGLRQLGSNFRVYHLVDSCGAHNETRKDDNLVWTGLTIELKDSDECP